MYRIPEKVLSPGSIPLARRSLHSRTSEGFTAITGDHVQYRWGYRWAATPGIKATGKLEAEPKNGVGCRWLRKRKRDSLLTTSTYRDRSSLLQISRLLKGICHLQYAPVVMISPHDLYSNWQSALRECTRH